MFAYTSACLPICLPQALPLLCAHVCGAYCARGHETSLHKAGAALRELPVACWCGETELPWGGIGFALHFCTLSCKRLVTAGREEEAGRELYNYNTGDCPIVYPGK